MPYASILWLLLRLTVFDKLPKNQKTPRRPTGRSPLRGTCLFLFCSNRRSVVALRHSTKKAECPSTFSHSLKNLTEAVLTCKNFEWNFITFRPLVYFIRNVNSPMIIDFLDVENEAQLSNISLFALAHFIVNWRNFHFLLTKSLALFLSKFALKSQITWIAIE